MAENSFPDDDKSYSENIACSKRCKKGIDMESTVGTKDQKIASTYVTATQTSIGKSSGKTGSLHCSLSHGMYVAASGQLSVLMLNLLYLVVACASA